MTNVEQREAAKKFAENWKGRGYEKGDSQIFWIELLTTVFGVTDISSYITFEDQVKLDHTSFIDGYIESTHVMIEQKSIDKSLTSPIKQSDGSLLTPFQQAKRYSAELPYSKRPRWIVTSNFQYFYVYDMEQPSGEPEIIALGNLEKEYYRLQFLVDERNESLQKEMEVSIKAGELVGLIYDALYKQYKDPDEMTLKSLNALCVRLVFCLYAEDAGIFGHRGMFRDYMSQFSAKDWRKRLIELFQVLDTKECDRDKYIEEDLGAFPYVNGGLFADESIEIPPFTDEIVDLVLHKASDSFDWSEISPTIFGAVFESTLNPETRRSGGMHYTSIENIHKVIDPLFLDELNDEFVTICALTVERTKKAKLQAFQQKLATLKFLDPACGSGNFLTETYISLRKLENKVITEFSKGQMFLGDLLNPIMVSISQFYGIEINDFAVTVAKTALWIAESQMMKETENIVHMQLEFLPLKTNAYIVESNALRLDWNDVVPKQELNYIMGNPPFVGAQNMSKEQKKDLMNLFENNKKAGVLDYVTGWYYKASEIMNLCSIKTSFVSTNSITQGEQVAALWKVLYEKFGIHIDFAYRTFRWDSEANNKAHVHCVIIGFSTSTKREMKKLYTEDRFVEVQNISPYLSDAPNIFIESRKQPICDVPVITKGCQPTDGGNLIIEEAEREEFIRREPNALKYIKRLVGAREFINNQKRWCLWLVGVAPNELRSMPLVLERIEKVREMRLNSADAGTRKLADTPTVFRETYNPDTFIIIPSVSSEKRRYIPLGFEDKNTISTNLNLIIPDATLYHFGVLTSNVHMSWMRAVAGRLEMRYRYSKDIVYNNFPWPTPIEELRKKIEQTAQAILDARALYPNCSLADLYDELTMPSELRKAHQQNDKAVMQAYGFWGKLNSESECVAELMKMYQELTKEE
ncbi:MAG: class I SAM-dependent DNA methyltransferase [Lachnospiraceae bacterium]|nr:class I SAM-dependent DNA methyltransferase [Lachnospiraceae bacterium]